MKANLVVALGLFVLISPAAGQERLLPSGVSFPGHGAAAPSAVLGGLENPAGVGLTPGEISLWGGSRALGGGLGLALGALKISSTLDYLLSPEADGLWRAGLGFALAPSSAVSLGAVWSPIWGGGLPDGGISVWSAGALLRPNRWFSLGFYGSNLGMVSWLGRENIGLTAGFAVRPGWERLTFGADVTTDDEGNYWDPTAYLTVALGWGLSLGGSVGLHDDDDGFGLWGGGTLGFAMPHSELQAGVRANPASGDVEYAVGSRMVVETPAHALLGGKKLVRMAFSPAQEVPSAFFFAPRSSALLEQRLTLRKMARDREVGALVLVIKPGAGGWARVQELGRSLAELKASGKKIVAYLYGGSNREYYLASFADRIVVHPAAVLSFTGIRATAYFLADLLKSLYIDAQFVRIGPWKSAPEPYMNSEPSPEYVAQQTSMLDEFYTQLVGEIAKNRGVERSKVEGWVDAGPQTPKAALKMGMVDEVSGLDEMTALKDLGIHGLQLVHGYPFHQVASASWGPVTDVAVLVVEGTMVDGRSGGMPLLGQTAGAEDIVPVIKALEKDPSTSAVLVRVNSPGGSPQAAERMLQAIKALAKAKPVVISMGDVAASGGYYMAMSGDRIFAMPGTITGSIGIYFGKVVFSRLLEKLGLHRFELVRGKGAGWGDFDRPFSDEDLAKVRLALEEYYGLFLERVGEGRKLKPEELDKLAEGRVYTGSMAVANKLVDLDGGALEALDHLRDRLGLDEGQEVALQFYPKPSFAQALQKSLGMAAGTELLQQASLFLDAMESLAGVSIWAMDPWLMIMAP